MKKKNSKLAFYAQSTITVISGRGEKEKQASIRYALKKNHLRWKRWEKFKSFY